MPNTPVSVRAATLARVHTALSLAAFLSALLVGCALHYKKIVKNGVAGWPQEWFPSVSATIGDWYPERNIFQILIALNSGPRFAVLLLSYALTRTAHPGRSQLLLYTGIVRTFSCGGWVFITSSDAGDTHDFFMILYIVCNLPWMWAGLGTAGRRARRWRVLAASAFWLSIVPMVYFYIQHKVHRVPGAYTRYAFFEWSLIFLDIAYDTTTIMLFNDSGLELTLALADGAALPLPEANKITAPEPAAPPVTVRIVDSISPTEIANATLVRNFASFLSDVYLAYTAWTLLTALPLTLFYFSIWKLALAGPEFATLATLSPLLLAAPSVRGWARTPAAQTLLSAAGLLALGVYKSENIVSRLVGVAMGTAAVCLRLAGEWDGSSSDYHALVLVLGLIVSSLFKHLNDGNNPLWPILDEQSGGHHRLLLTLGVFALAERATRPPTPPPPPQPIATKLENKQEPWLLPALALGAALYGLHERLSDPAALPAWAWAGFAGVRTGPHPHTHAGPVLLACAAGAALSSLCASEYTLIRPRGKMEQDEKKGSGKAYVVSRAPTNVITHPLFFALAALPSCYLLLYATRWPAYFGGLLHAFFLSAIFPLILHNAARAAHACGAARVFGTTWAAWVMLLFSGTFTVAYAFVPGAGPFRERTDLVLGAQMLLLAPTFAWRTPASKRAAPAVPSGTRGHALLLLALLSLTALAAPLFAAAPTVSAPAPRHARARLFNAGIWTVHFGLDDAGRDSQRRMRDLMRDMRLDVVGLLETDLFRPVFGNRDLTRVMARELGYHVDIGPGPNRHTWGAVLLSKFPILRSTHHLLPSPAGELAPAIEAVLDVYGAKVTVIVAHNGQEETPLDRELQATALAKIMRASPYPVVFLGYVVTKPGDRRPSPYEIMVTDGQVHDVDDEDWDRWCEYIFYRGLHRTAYARVSRSTITDTELQIGQFVVPRAGRTNKTKEAARARRYIRSHKEDLPSEHWFPQEYYGSEREGGVRGHFYHVFNTPLYYQIPKGKE